MKEYDLFLPLSFNDGSPVPARCFKDVQQRLLDEFGGVTYFPQPNEGLWRMGGVTYRDEIVIYRIVARNVRAARRFFTLLKEELKVSFQQEDIFIVVRDVEVM